VLRSDGNFIRDYIYVKDVSNAYLRLAEAMDEPGIKGEGFNFSPESRVSVLQIVDKIRKLMNCSDIQPTILNQAQGEILNQYLSPEKADRLLQWKVSFDLDRGLSETIQWYRDFFGGQQQ
jgi:CDP-glucose 4,6-dehydratase